MKTIKIQCELVVHVGDDSDIKQVLSFIREDGSKCFGTCCADYWYEIQKFQKLKVLK